MKSFTFLLLAAWITACGQEPVGEMCSSVWKRLFTKKPQSMTSFVDSIITNKQLIGNTTRLDGLVKKYIERGGDINAVYNGKHTMLSLALDRDREDFAAVLVANDADKDLAVRKILENPDRNFLKPADEGDNRLLDWKKVSWLIERGAARSVVDDYLGNMIEGNDFNLAGDNFSPKEAILSLKHGADEEKALLKALREKRQDVLELLIDSVDKQLLLTLLNRVMHVEDYDAVKMFLTAGKDKDTQIDVDQVLLRSMQKDRKTLLDIALNFGANKARLIKKLLQEKDYDNLKIVLKEQTWQNLNIWGVLANIFQTKDPDLVKLILPAHDGNNKIRLDYILQELLRIGDRDTAEFVVAQGGNSDILLADIIKSLDLFHSRAKFDEARVNRLIVLGANPNREIANDDFVQLTIRVIQDISASPVLSKKDDEVLSLLFKYIPDRINIERMSEAHELLSKLKNEQQQQKVFDEAVSDFDDKAKAMYQEGIAADKDWHSVRDSLITLLEEYGVAD